MPKSTLSVTPGGAMATQSPFDVGSMAGGDGMGGFGSLLAQQLALKEQMARLQMDRMRQQMALAQQQAQMGASDWRAQRRARGGGFKGLTGRKTPMKERLIEWAGQMRPFSGAGGFGGGPQAFFAAQDAMSKAAALGGPGGGSAGIGGYQEPVPSLAVLGGRARAAGVRQPSRGFFEEGGRVPKTGTYKLHKREVVVPANAADAMFPYAMRGPQTSKSKAEKSYQEGTVAPSQLDLILRGLGVFGQIPRGVMELPGLLEGPAGGPPMPEGPVGLMPQEPELAEFPAERRPYYETERKFPGLEIDRGEGGVKEYKLTGKPMTEKEERDQIRDQIKKDKESARYHKSRANLLLSYFAEQPEKLADPKVKALLSQRQFLAQQFQGEADKEEARLDKMEQAEKQQETMKDIQRISTGGQRELAEIQSMVAMRDYWRDAFETTQKEVQSILKDEYTDRNSPMYRSRMETQYSTFVPLLSQALGQIPEQTYAFISEAIEESIKDPSELGLLNSLIAQQLSRMGSQAG